MADAAAMRVRAEEIAEEVLFPAAMSVDRADRIPASHLDLLAEEGFYGVAAPPEAGGLGVADMAAAAHLVETLASGCLATAFVWIQHHGCVLAAAFSQQPGVTERWLGPLARGERRGGIALAGIRPSAGAAAMRVRPVKGGFLLDGEAPWVTGWDMIDTVHVAARDAGDVIHYLLVDAVPAATLTVRPLELVAVQASRTVNLTFAGHFVPADRLTGRQPSSEWARSDASGSALNGSLALGVVRRCCRILGPSPLDAELDACRAELLAADAASTPDARAAASQLALRASGAVTVHTGSRAVLRDNHAQRLVREAAFLLVFGSRPAIRDALLRGIGLVTPAVSGAARSEGRH
jgi:alkylation response protein AidB-like acyl-CoA dehydrogenase